MDCLLEKENKKWYAITKTLPVVIGTVNPNQNLDSNGPTRALIPL